MFYFPKKSNASVKEWQHHYLERTPQLRRACLIVIGKHRRGVWDNSIKFSTQLSPNNNDHHEHLVSRGDLTKLNRVSPLGPIPKRRSLTLNGKGVKIMITIFTLYLKYLRYQLLKVATRIIERPLYSEISSQPAPPLLLKLNAPMPLVQPFCGTWNCQKSSLLSKFLLLV